jgi:hypothetical protein
MWAALSRIYLTDSEVTDANPKTNSKFFINLIKKRLFLNIWEKMQKFDEKSPPFLTQNDFPLKCCKAIINETEDVKWGHLQLNEENFTIYLNKNLNETKKRTVLAHELGHTFLYDLQKKPITPYYHRERSLDLLHPNIYDLDEGFVYEIGRFLLVPSKAISKYISKNPTLDSFLDACSQFQTTKDVMAKRLIWDIHDFDTGEKFWNTALLIFYQIAEEGDDILWEIPKGNKYIYRGVFFKNFHFEKYWPLIVPLLNTSLRKPNVLLKSSLVDTVKLKQIIFKNSKIKVELKYLPNDKRIYILFSKK